METAIPIPALTPVLRALEGACVILVDDEGGMDARRVGELVEDSDADVDADVGMDVGVDVGSDVGVDVGMDVDADAEGVEDGVMLLLMDEVAEDDVAGLDSVCVVKDSGDGA